jgi:hypothetical protein
MTTPTPFPEFESIQAASLEIGGVLRGMRASLARGPGKMAEELPSLLAAVWTASVAWSCHSRRPSFPGMIGLPSASRRTR